MREIILIALIEVTSIIASYALNVLVNAEQMQIKQIESDYLQKHNLASPNEDSASMED